MNDENRKNLQLVVNWWRVSETDTFGCLDVTANGFKNWLVCDIGCGAGFQGESKSDEKVATEFAIELASLVRKHFGAIPPVLEPKDVAGRVR